MPRLIDVISVIAYFGFMVLVAIIVIALAAYMLEAGKLIGAG